MSRPSTGDKTPGDFQPTPTPEPTPMPDVPESPVRNQPPVVEPAPEPPSNEGPGRGGRADVSAPRE